MVEKMVTALKSGNENPLRIEAAMANIEAVVKEYRANKDVKEILLDEVRKYHNATAEIYNATFQEGESYEVNPPKRTASCQVVVTIKK